MPARAPAAATRARRSPMRRVSTMRMFRRSVISSMCRLSNSGRARSPSITGATYSSSSSTRPAVRNAPASVAPASTCTSLISRSASSSSTAAEIDAARFDGHRRRDRLRRRAACAHRGRAGTASAHRLRGRARAHGRQARIEHDAQRRHERRVVAQAHGEMRIVDQHGARAGEDRAGACAPLLHVAPRGFAADPLRIAGGQRAAAVEARRELHAHPRTPAFDAREEAAD